MAYFFYNQEFYPNSQTVISPCDRGFTLGDGIFETIKITNKHPELWDAHYNRLAKGCAVFHLNMPNNLYEDALRLIHKNTLDNAVLKIILSRKSDKRGLAFGHCFDANTTMTLSPLPPQPIHIKAIISDIRRNDTTPLSRVKSLNYGDNLLAFNQATDWGYDDALMLNTKNQPCCFTIGNIVIENKQGEWLTPPIETGCLEGTFLTTLPHLKYRNFDLCDAVTMWRSNSVSGLVPVNITYNAN